MFRSSVGALFLLLAGGTVSCADETRFQVGYVDFWIEFYDPVIDRFGVVQEAYCARYVTFQGDIDTACAAFPMIWSFPRDARFECTYRDARGVPQYYTDLFFFYAGYIQEPPCFEGYPYPAAALDTDVAGRSELERDDDGRLVVPEALPPDAPSLEELRETLSGRLRSAAEPPDALPEDEPAEPVRASDTGLGDPPPETD